MPQGADLVAEAELQLAISYLYGDEVQYNIELAIKYLEESSRKGNSKAQLLLSTIEQKDEDVIYPEALIHTTISGLKVRSKSEVIIANTLICQNIEFKYEKRLYLSSGKFFVPDFTINCFNGNKIIWEHLGLLTNDSYMKKWINKKQTYQKEKFTEGNDLFVTIDEKNGSIDSRHVLSIAIKIKKIAEEI
jgi:hypothetical protein